MAQLNIAWECLFAHGSPNERAREALVFVGRAPGARTSHSRQELCERVQRTAAGLSRLGLLPGDRVVILLPNGPAFVAAFFASLFLGLVATPLSVMLTADEVGFVLRDSRARLLVTEAASIARARAARSLAQTPTTLVVVGDGECGGDTSWNALAESPARPFSPETRDDDPAYLVYTSGTTSRPKGVLHAHRSILGRDIVTREWSGLCPQDRVAHAGSLNWTFTLGVGLMDPLRVGAVAILAEGSGRVDDWPARIARERVTVFAAVPSVYRQLLQDEARSTESMRSLRHALSAGEPLPVSVHQRWLHETGVPIFTALGMTEVSTYVSFGPRATPRPGASGVAQAGRRIRVLSLHSTEEAKPNEVGRLAIARDDPGLMIGYFGRPEETSSMFEGDWFVGGDLVTQDETGVISFFGRSDDIVKSMGYRISPLEVESVLGAHPMVRECMVRVETVEDGLDILVAHVGVHAGQEWDEEALRAHASAHLSRYKCPKKYVQADKLARTLNGKLIRRAGPQAG